VTLGDPASQLHDVDEPSTAPPEHIQQSAGRMPTVANATSEKVCVFLNYICIFSLKVLMCRIWNDHFLAFRMFVKCNVYCVLMNINTLVERFFPRTHHSTSPILSANFCEPTLILLSPLSFYYPHSPQCQPHLSSVVLTALLEPRPHPNRLSRTVATSDLKRMRLVQTRWPPTRRRGRYSV
jgi:hypothetical protein